MQNKIIRVLLVDDNQADRDLIKYTLLNAASLQFEVEEADSDKAFMLALAPGKFDIVLSDFNILGFTGTETIQAVKSVEPELPVIIVTGTGSEEIAVQCLQNGAAEYIFKNQS